MNDNNVSVSVVSPSDEGFDTIQQSAEQSITVRVDYNAVADQYNKAKIGSILLVHAPSRYRAGNCATVLTHRGLEEDVDFSVTRLVRDKNDVALPKDQRPIAVTKLTDKEVRLI